MTNALLVGIQNITMILLCMSENLENSAKIIKINL